MIIVAAFEPFGRRSINRSWEAAKRLRGRKDLEVVQLPVDFVRLRDEVPALVARRPGALLLVGEANRRKISVEQLAVNVLDCDRPDNRGRTAENETVVGGAPLAVEARWDGHAVARRLNEAGIAASVSFSAGTFACNQSLYLALQASAAVAIPVGFLHVPVRSWPLGPSVGRLARAVEIAAGALMEREL